MDGDRMDSESAALLRRKIAAIQPRADPLLMTPERALATAFARIAEKTMKLPIRVQTQGLAQLSAAEVVETLPDHALLAMTEGPKEALGLVVFDCGTLSCLTEMLTLGRLATAQPPGIRRPTRTDAAMVAGIIDGVLSGLEGLLAAEDAVIWAGGFRYASHLADPRPLGLMLDEPAYRVVRLSLAFGVAEGDTGAADRRGDVIVVFPAKGRGPAPKAWLDACGQNPVDPSKTGGAMDIASQQKGAKDWSEAMERAVAQAQTQVEAVLGRVTLALAEVLKLEPGVSLTVPMSALKLVQIEGATGSLICLGQLGQGNGRRALRLYPPEQDNATPMAPPVAVSEVVLASEQPFLRKPLTNKSAEDPPELQDVRQDAIPGAPAQYNSQMHRGNKPSEEPATATSAVLEARAG